MVENALLLAVHIYLYPLMDFLDISSIEGSQNSLCSSSEEPGREILVLTIDIGHGRTDEIVIREHESPRFVAREFCRKHQLSPEAEKVLINVIKQHVHTRPVVEVSMMAEQKSRNEEQSKACMSVTSKEESKIKEETTVREAEVSKQSKSYQKPNYGERLYQVGLIQKEKTEKKMNDMRERLNQEKMKDITFKPSITPERMMPRLQLLQPESCPRPVDRCQMLYNKAQKARSLQKSAQVVSQKAIESRKNLQHYLEQREQARRNQARSKSPSVHWKDSRKSMRSHSQELKVKLSNEQTDKIIDRIKAIRFMQLFQILNPNERQQIDRESVRKICIPKIVEGILGPFLEELRNIQHGLNLEQFCNVMELYIKELTPEERTALLEIGKHKGNTQVNHNFIISTDTANDLWSPKHEEKLLVFEQFPEINEKD